MTPAFTVSDKIKENMKHVQIFSDGSCLGNPGKGGYGAILRYNEHEREISAGYALTTNNRMELMAVISGLEALKEPCEVTITTDSRYVMDGMTKWMDSWIKKGFFQNNSSKIKNQDLWTKIYNYSKVHKLNWVWVKGHNNHPENERCDELAKKAANGTNLLKDTGYNAK